MSFCLMIDILERTLYVSFKFSDSVLAFGKPATVADPDPCDHMCRPLRLFPSRPLAFSADTDTILFVFSTLLVLARRQDRLRRLRSMYPPFSRKE